MPVSMLPPRPLDDGRLAELDALMTAPRRAERKIVEAALNWRARDTADRRRELRIASMTGAEERRMVARAIEDADRMSAIRRGIIDGVRAERARIEAEAMAGAERAIQEAVAVERARCAAIADEWPDNLMARAIARKIRGDE